jgi:hypothetical protein
VIVRVRNRHTASVGTLAPGAIGLVEESFLAGKLGRWLVPVESPAPAPPAPAASPAPAPEALVEAPAPARRRKGEPS